MGDDAARALLLTRKRQKEQEETAFMRQKIADDFKFDSIDGRFSAKYDSIEERVKNETVGLLTLDQMKAKRDKAIKEHDIELALTRERRAERRKQQQQQQANESEPVKPKKAVDKSKLSFAFDGEEDDDDAVESLSEGVTSPSTVAAGEASRDKSNLDADAECSQEKVGEDADALNDSGAAERVNISVSSEEPDMTEAERLAAKRRRFGMNPDVDTSFLPDREREEHEEKLRGKLAREWRMTQEKIKNEEVEITYSYWDGSGHRRAVRIKKGFSIQQFLQKSLEALRGEFNELRVVGVDQLMFVKEDLIIPHHYTFYEFIVTKARGKSGPLFDFTVRNDIRLVNDASVEKEESHAGKICLRSWYERNKHIFPASRWEPYDPEKKWDKYTIKDGKSAAKTSTALTAPAALPPL